jgi:very-short-patch-repair endonuclease
MPGTSSRGLRRSARDQPGVPLVLLVVETDGRRYHRTPLAQGRDIERDQTHTASGLTPLRFTHHQVKYRPEHVRRILASTASRLNQRG